MKRVIVWIAGCTATVGCMSVAGSVIRGEMEPRMLGWSVVALWARVMIEVMFPRYAEPAPVEPEGER